MQMFRTSLALLCVLTCSIVIGDPIKVLIIDGFHNHDWQRTTDKITEILEAEGGFVVESCTVPEVSL